MTLDELIKQAQKLKDDGVPGDIKVLTEGWDRDAKASGFKVDERQGGSYLLVTGEFFDDPD